MDGELAILLVCRDLVRIFLEFVLLPLKIFANCNPHANCCFPRFENIFKSLHIVDIIIQQSTI